MFGFLVVILLLKPTVHFWLHHTAQCGGWGHPQDGLYMVAARPSGSIPALVAQTGLEKNTTLTFWGFISGMEGGLGSEWVFANREC